MFPKRYCYSAKLAITLIIIAAAHPTSSNAFKQASYVKRKVASNAVDHASTSITSFYSPQYVAKTTESFKLADLFWLQANVMAYCDNDQSAVQKLAFHRPTASLLLGYNGTSSNSSDQGLPFPTNRVQYVGVVVASGATAQDLLDCIKTTSASFFTSSTTNCNYSWTLDCDTFEPLAGRQFTTSMIMCAVSRHLSGEPVLGRDDIDDETISYLLVETSSKLYLIQKLPIDNQMHDTYQENLNRFRQEWARRPFQYSGAVNIEIAITVVDMLQRLVSKNGEEPKDNRRIRLLDPTCGSGSFLAAAAQLWNSNNHQNESLDIVGIDSNFKCSDGASKNFCKLFGLERISEEEDSRGKRWTVSGVDPQSELPIRTAIYCGDSAELLSSKSLYGEFDCVVSNLPWNRNTFEYEQETSNCKSTEIITRIAEVVKPGKPVIVVSGSNDPALSFNAKRTFKELGFDIVGEVTIPPAGFSLPESGKKKNTVASDRQTNRNSNCVVTIVIAPR
eukprot:scaffold2118_cov145-Skeletonema_menzelii.AAC.2